MKAFQILMCAGLVACLGGFVFGCSGGSDMDIQATGGGQANLTPEDQVMQAAATGDTKTLESVVAANPQIVAFRGINGMTPLHTAAANGKDAAVTFLLEHGADPVSLDDNDSTPVNTARAEGHPGTATVIEDWIAKNGSTAPQAPAQSAGQSSSL